MSGVACVAFRRLSGFFAARDSFNDTPHRRLEVNIRRLFRPLLARPPSSARRSLIALPGACLSSLSDADAAVTAQASAVAATEVNIIDIGIIVVGDIWRKSRRCFTCSPRAGDVTAD